MQTITTMSSILTEYFISVALWLVKLNIVNTLILVKDGIRTCGSSLLTITPNSVITLAQSQISEVSSGEVGILVLSS